MCITHQHVPLLYIIESINTNLKVSCEDQNLNPVEKTSCKGVINCLVHFCNTITDVSDLCKVVCLEVACIFQGIPNVGSPDCEKILGVTEDMVI